MAQSSFERGAIRPQNGKWTLTGAMGKERYDHTATILSDGQVLVSGSYENAGDALSSAEVYTPGTGKWKTLHRLNADHNGHTATVLLNGKVLIVGGDAVGRMEFWILVRSGNSSVSRYASWPNHVWKDFLFQWARWLGCAWTRAVPSFNRTIVLSECISIPPRD